MGPWPPGARIWSPVYRVPCSGTEAEWRGALFWRETGESGLRHCAQRGEHVKLNRGLLKLNWIVTGVALMLASVAVQNPLF